MLNVLPARVIMILSFEAFAHNVTLIMRFLIRLAKSFAEMELRIQESNVMIQTQIQEMDVLILVK